MALVNKKTDFKDGRLDLDSNVSAADTALTVSTIAGPIKRLVSVEVKYSAVPVQTGVTVTRNSGVTPDGDHDSLLAAGTANAQHTVYIPDEELLLDTLDVIDVLAPAGGGVITSAISIYTEAV